MPSPLALLPLFLFLDLLASAEIREEAQPQSIAGTFQGPDPRGEDINTYESGVMISSDPCPPVIESDLTEMPTTNSMFVFLNSEEPECGAVENSWPHRFASATSSTSPPIVLEATPIEGTVTLHSDHVPAGIYHAATTTVTDVPLTLHNAMDYLIAKHPKILSTVSTVLTTVGGIILFPGVSACARGTILAHPAVTIAGGIALAVGRRLRRALNSATALAAAQGQESGQVNIEDVDDHRRDGTEPDRLLSLDRNK